MGGSGIREVLRPCMAEFMGTKEYYDICVKHDLVSSCYKNEFFEGGEGKEDKTILPTNEQDGDCSDGYCPCDADADAGIDIEKVSGSLKDWVISLFNLFN